MSKVTLGLSAILGSTTELAAGGDAFKETGYTRFGLTYQDTANMNTEDGETTEFYAEEEDDPVDDITKPGKTTFNFSIMDPTLETLKRLFGGEIASDVCAYPDVVVECVESLIIKPRKGLAFHLTRAKIKSKINGEFSKKGLLLVECTATATKPTATGVKKMYIKKLTATPAT